MKKLARAALALTVGSVFGSTVLWAGHAGAEEFAPLTGSAAVAVPAAAATPTHTAQNPAPTVVKPAPTKAGSTSPKVGAGTSARSLAATPSVIPGVGKRVWFSVSAQQVWLVNSDGSVAHTYLVSGSRYGQLKPGTYSVFSRSSKTTSWNSNAQMQYMVRFARGKNAAIGFHSIPRYPSGKLAQTEAQLGLPLSDGCVRQRLSDAKELWNFAPVGTTVLVTK